MVEFETFVHVNNRLCRAIRRSQTDKKFSRPQLFFEDERQHGIPAQDSSDAVAVPQQGSSYSFAQRSFLETDFGQPAAAPARNSVEGKAPALPQPAEEVRRGSSTAPVPPPQQQGSVDVRRVPSAAPTSPNQRQAGPTEPTTSYRSQASAASSFGDDRKPFRGGNTSLPQPPENKAVRDPTPKTGQGQRVSVLSANRASVRMSTMLVNEHPLLFLLLASNPTRIERMHLPEWKDLLTAFRMQRTRRCLCPFSAYNGYTGAIWLLVQGLTLILIGVGVLTLGGGHEPVKLEYSSQNTNLEFDLENSLKPPIYVYYGMSQFYGNFRTYQTSKPEELWGGFSCADFTTRERFDQVRPDGTLPEAEETEGEFVNPCGLSSWAYYNDRFSIFRVLPLPPGEAGLGQQQIALDKTNVADWTTFILYAKDLDEEDDSFISTFDQSYRVWLPSMFTPMFKKLYAVIHEELTAGEYRISFDVNLWPDEQWHSDKSIIIESHGLVGTGDIAIAITFFSAGGVAVFFSFLIYLGKAVGFEYGGKSLSLVSADRLEAHPPRRSKSHSAPSVQVALPPSAPAQQDAGISRETYRAAEQGPVKPPEPADDDTYRGNYEEVNREGGRAQEDQEFVLHPREEQDSPPPIMQSFSMGQLENSVPSHNTDGPARSDSVTSVNQEPPPGLFSARLESRVLESDNKEAAD